MGARRSRPAVGARAALTTALLSLGLSGCGGLHLGAPTPGPVLNASVPSADELAAPYRAQAEMHERHGRLRPAREAWTTALAFAPDHVPSRRGLKRVRQRIEQEVADRVRLGWHALSLEAVVDARRHFLAALALDPDSPAARDGLRAVGIAVEPNPRPAASLARPAGLSPNDPHFADGPKPRVEPSSTPARTEPAPEPRSDVGETEAPAVLYATARTHLAAGRHDAAYRALTRLARVSPGYRDAAVLLRDVRARLVRERYQEGLRLFREEMLEQAIEQWRAVLELDPAHVDAGRNIEQAEKMLRTLAAQPRR